MKNNYGLTLTRRGLLLFIALWGSLSSLLAQPNVPPVYWQTVLDKRNTANHFRGENVSRLDLARAPDGSSILVAYPSSAYQATQPYVSKIDPNGKLVWTSKAADFFTPVAVQTQSSGDIIVAGDFAYSSRPLVGLTRFNANGFLNFITTLDLPESPNIQRNLGDMIPSPDGGFLLVGYETLLNTPTPRLDLLLVKVDRNLNVSWTKTIGGSGQTFLFKASRATDGGYVVHSSSSATSITGNPDTRNGLIYDFKIDENGTIVWQTVGSQIGVYRVITPRPGGYYAIGNYHGIGSVAVVKLDNQLNLIQGTALPNPDERNSQYTISVATTPDGGCITVDKRVDSYPNGPHSDYRITKFSSSLAIDWQEQGGGAADDDARRVLVNPDGTYQIAGTTASPGFFGRVDDEGKVAVWVRRQAVNSGAFQLMAPTYTCATGAITLNTTGGDGSPIVFTAPGISRNSPTANTGIVEAGLRQDPSPIYIQATQRGVTVSLYFDLKAVCNGGGPAPGGSLTLSQPTYNCSSGAITFNTAGGDGSPITFVAPGVARATPTSNAGVVEAGLRVDPKPITIQATQSGKNVSLTFDLKAYCNGGGPTPNPGNSLALIQPSYDCSTGAIRFNATGGDGTPISYMAPGISRESEFSNTGTVEIGLRYDPKPITIQATQSGKTTSYQFDLGRFCNPSNQNARLAENESGQKLAVKILENPVHQQLRVELTGASQKPVQLRIVDLRGQLIQIRHITPDHPNDKQEFGVNQLPAGLYILQATSGQQGQTLKFLKQ